MQTSYRASTEQLSLLDEPGADTEAACTADQGRATEAPAPLNEASSAVAPLLGQLLELGVTALNAVSRGGAGGADEDAMERAIAPFGAVGRLCGTFMALMKDRGCVVSADGRLRLTDAGRRFLARLQERRTQPVEDPVCPAQWRPALAPWRHGGWYVHNVKHIRGGCGCVSRNYRDKRWRIVCDDRRGELGEEGDVTFLTRLEAARAEYVLTEAMKLAWAEDEATPPRAGGGGAAAET